MADEGLRELEKRFRETGSPVDEAAWLRERVRQGDGAPARISFPGNPWPLGHRIETLTWKGRLEPSGLWFDLDLETANDSEGDAADEEDEPEGSDWQAKIAWNNDHRCSISSNRGFLAGSEREPLDFGALEQRSFHVDPVADGADADSLDHDELGFRVYLLGHDTVADHRIRFAAREDASTYWVSCSGSAFEHSFRLPLARVRFEGIALKPSVGDEEARALVRRFVWKPEELEARVVSGDLGFGTVSRVLALRGPEGA